MTRHQHLLIRAMEECAEVQQRISKALVFGMDEVQPGQDLTNRARVVVEFIDLLTVMEMAGFPATAILGHRANTERIEQKRLKVEKFLRYSREMGTLTATASATPTQEDEHDDRRRE